MRTHYEVLGVPDTALQEDIVKAYKGLAKKYHPDKNKDNPEAAHEMFLCVQKAYNVLSDPVERVWYDRNKNACLLSDKVENFVDVSLYLNKNVFNSLSDTEDGFFTIYRKLFNSIAQEEILFDGSLKFTDFPSFGYMKSDFITCVKPFYSFWSTFKTKKDFAWLNERQPEKYMNRYEVRAINKENYKRQLTHQRSYSVEVRNVVSFVRRHDNRIPVKIEPVISKSKKAKGVRFVNDVDWNKHYEDLLGDLTEMEDKIDELLSPRKKNEEVLPEDFDDVCDANFSAVIMEEDTISAIKCFLCGKNFKNVPSFMCHVRSKKHVASLNRFKKKKTSKVDKDEYYTPPSSESELHVNVSSTGSVQTEDSQIYNKSKMRSDNAGDTQRKDTNTIHTFNKDEFDDAPIEDGHSIGLVEDVSDDPPFKKGLSVRTSSCMVNNESCSVLQTDKIKKNSDATEKNLKNGSSEKSIEKNMEPIIFAEKGQGDNSKIDSYRIEDQTTLGDLKVDSATIRTQPDEENPKEDPVAIRNQPDGENSKGDPSAIRNQPDGENSKADPDIIINLQGGNNDKAGTSTIRNLPSGENSKISSSITTTSQKEDHPNSILRPSSSKSNLEDTDLTNARSEFGKSREKGSHMAKGTSPKARGVILSDEELDTEVTAEMIKQYKQKKKGLKKQSRRKVDNQEGAVPSVCEICSSEFPSRTKLFEHIKKTGHAALKEDNRKNKCKKR